MTDTDYYRTHYAEYHDKTFRIDPAIFLSGFVKHLRPGAEKPVVADNKYSPRTQQQRQRIGSDTTQRQPHAKRSPRAQQAGRAVARRCRRIESSVGSEKRNPQEHAQADNEQPGKKGEHHDKPAGSGRNLDFHRYFSTRH